MKKYSVIYQGQKVNLLTKMSAQQLNAVLKKQGYEVTEAKPEPFSFQDKVNVTFAGPVDYSQSYIMS